MYDSKEELLRKIALGEDSTIEFKEVNFREGKIPDLRRDSLSDEIAAMANTSEGVILFGVDDSREIQGIPLSSIDDVERIIREVCFDIIKPPMVCRIIKMELPDSSGTLQPIIKVDIPKSLFVHQSNGGYLYRQGSSKRQMPPDLLARLFQQRSQARLIRFEEQAVPQTDFYLLDELLWKRFTTRSDESPEIVLLKRNLLAKDDNGAVRASVAGILMCTRKPAAFLPSAFIQAVSYRGTGQDSNYQLDAVDIHGPLDEQIDQACLFVKKSQRYHATKEPDRKEIPQFNERAVFEAVVNAVAHRDYSIYASKIRLFIFEDRLELYSPGALPNTVTIESIELRQATRNELLTSLLAECPVNDKNTKPYRKHYMEKRGDGVPIILRESLEISGVKPVYTLIDNSELRLTIYSQPHTENQ
jgi:ATP-dependent DNA helicase RecG